MRQKLAAVIEKFRALGIDDVDHHIIACGYLITGLVCDGHSTVIMTAVYLWAGRENVKALRAVHMPAFLSHRCVPAARGTLAGNRQVAAA
jgi:hypothetical protein